MKEEKLIHNEWYLYVIPIAVIIAFGARLIVGIHLTDKKRANNEMTATQAGLLSFWRTFALIAVVVVAVYGYLLGMKSHLGDAIPYELLAEGRVYEVVETLQTPAKNRDLAVIRGESNGGKIVERIAAFDKSAGLKNGDKFAVENYRIVKIKKQKGGK